MLLTITPSQGMHMIRYTSDRQITLEGFTLPFGGKLNQENRWIKWHKVIPWDEFAIRYYRNLDPHQGRPAKNARLVIGALIIKHKLTLSDEETGSIGSDSIDFLPIFL